MDTGYWKYTLWCCDVAMKSCPLIEGSLEVKLPTILTDEKQRWEESERKEE
jgi:hypothetical protein